MGQVENRKSESFFSGGKPKRRRVIEQAPVTENDNLDSQKQADSKQDTSSKMNDTTELIGNDNQSKNN